MVPRSSKSFSPTLKFLFSVKRRFAYHRESSNSYDSDEGVRKLLSALEAEIDEAVYDLFDLDESEREVIEEYLEVF
jgi:hypothetical protein